MKNKNEEKKLRGKEGFDEYYKKIYKERWNVLKESLLKQSSPLEYKIPESKKSYFLDSASILAAISLPLENAENILDLCAAPGGKTLVLSSIMNENAFLFANERSFERKCRLQNVIQTCIPEKISCRIKISCSDGSLWCKKHDEEYDAILLDAPCSSERHVLQDSKYLNDWSTSRIKTVTTEQWALLSSAYRILKPGGYLLYSTCALSTSENDEMILRLIKKFGNLQKNENSINNEFDFENFLIENPTCSEKKITEFCKFKIPQTEKTRFGQIVLPDFSGGFGPLYFCLIHKVNSIKKI